MNKILDRLLKLYTKKYLANMSFDGFLAIVEVQLPVKECNEGIIVEGKMYSYELLKIIHEDLKVQSSLSKRCLRKINKLLYLTKQFLKQHGQRRD